MSLQSTPGAERLHIGFFGCRNAGKSSLVNAVTDQYLSIVSETKGTTTDPVMKSMELLPAGPVVIIDTPGLDDDGQLGEKRISKALETLRRCDLCILVVDGSVGLQEADRQILARFRDLRIPYLIVFNKNDLRGFSIPAGIEALSVSAAGGDGIELLKKKIGELADDCETNRFLLRDLLEPGQNLILVCPIDSSAPKGRLILPQQLALREALDAHAAATVTQVEELEKVLSSLNAPPALVVTDSQAFARVSEIVPDDIMLTSFSILMARYKGFLGQAVDGAACLRKLRDGDRVLMAEGCSHHRQCGDIGTVKLPAWIREFSSSNPVFETVSGREFPEDLSAYRLIVQCGGCMLTEREVQYRMRCAMDRRVPFTNYGTAIAQMNGILERALRLFPDIHRMVK